MNDLLSIGLGGCGNKLLNAFMQLDSTKDGIFINSNINEMKSIEGGTGLTSSMLTAIYKTLEVIYQIGESLGNYIRRKTENKMCDI